MTRATLCILLLVAPPATGQTLDLRGFLTGRAAHASTPESWLDGGFGRFDFNDTALIASAEVGVDWTPSELVTVHAHGVARPENSGLVAAFIDLHNTSETNRLSLRAGQFFLPTSRENKGDLWSSPYTVTYSAINTWMGQEVRPVGVDVEWRHTTPGFNAVTVGATAFGYNDTMGTLLAWRGWSLGNYLPVYDELAPLPPLWSLPVFISDQNPEGTTPFRSDMDGRIGWSARTRVNFTDRASIQLTHLDNRGDHELYGDEYSWKTYFTLLGIEIGHTESTVLAGEIIHGYTAMGPVLDFLPHGRPVIVEFDSAYLLLSQKRGRHRYSARVDGFRLLDEDGSDGERSDEEGFALTAAWLYDLTARIRTAIELSHVSGESNLARESGFDPDTGGTSMLLEVRYSFW